MRGEERLKQSSFVGELAEFLSKKSSNKKKKGRGGGGGEVCTYGH